MAQSSSDVWGPSCQPEWHGQWTQAQWDEGNRQWEQKQDLGSDEEMETDLTEHNKYWEVEQELRTRTRHMTLREQEDVRKMGTHTWTREQALLKFGDAAQVAVCLG